MRWVLALLLGVGIFAAPARADITWLCQPGQGSNPCVGDLTTTAPRTGEVTRPRNKANPKIDCFYVYPTVSSELGSLSSKTVTPELRAIAELQARQFSRVCDVYAPVYRQVPVLQQSLGAETVSDAGYADVAEAFADFLARHPHRGVVLIGHGQGATLLRALIRNEVDPRPRVRRRLVSALLPGANVLEGDFTTVTPCARRGDTGCVAAWSTFDRTPPGDTRFGRATGSGALGLPTSGEVVCVNPAVLDGSRQDRVSTLVPSMPLFPGLLGLSFLQLHGGMPPTADTPWVRPRDRYTAQCTDDTGPSVLRLDPIGAVRGLTPSPDDSWGLHLYDMNIALGNLVGAVRAQTQGFRKVHLRVRRIGPRTTVTVRTAPGSKVRVTQRLEGRRTATRRVNVRSGEATVTLRSERLRHYDYSAKRLN